MVRLAGAVLMLAGVLWSAPPADAQTGEADPSVAVAARSFQPGELIVFTMTETDDPPTRVEVALFGRRATAFPLTDGRWRALIGIDLDQKPGTYTADITTTRIQHEVGAEAHRRRVIVVKPKTFATRTLTVSPDFVNPPASQLERIQRDSAFVREVYAKSADHRLWNRSFVAPVPDPANSRFGTRSVFNGEKRNPHAGADFASPAGRPIKAPNGGTIVAARELYYTGNTVIIDHGLGMFSLLAHMSRIDVKEGDEVRAGDMVGLVGATGRVTGPHLHWALTVSGARVDPVSALTVLGELPARK